MKHVNHAVIFLSLILSGALPVHGQTAQPPVSNIHAQPVRAVSGTTATSVQAGTGSQIRIRWKLAGTRSQSSVMFLQIYRDKKPITSESNLQTAVLLATIAPTATEYADTVESGTDYYYAVLALTKGNNDRTVLPAINATVTPARIAAGPAPETLEIQKAPEETLYPAGSLREIPLPALELLSEQRIQPIAMSDKAYAASQKYGMPVPKPEKLAPYAFEEDLISPQGGDEYILFDILHTTFARKNYTTAIDKLRDFLALNRSEEITDRAYFYLGECLYFTADYEQAIKMFLLVQDSYPQLTSRWIDSSLDLINIPD